MTTELDRVRDLAEQVRAHRAEHSELMEQLRVAIRDADANGGISRNQIVAAADGGLTRMRVYKTLGVRDLLADAERAIEADVNWNWRVYELGDRVLLSANGAYGERISGITPRAAPDPFQIDDFEDGTVLREAQDLIRELAHAGITAPDSAAEQLASSKEIELRRAPKET